MTQLPETPMTPHEAVVAWGTAAAAAQAAAEWVRAAAFAYVAAAGEYYDTPPTQEAAEGRRAAAVVAAGVETGALATYDRACEHAMFLRGAVCDAYARAGFLWAFEALGTLAPDRLGWTPDLEDALDALLAAPVRP